MVSGYLLLDAEKNVDGVKLSKYIEKLLLSLITFR